MNCSLTAFILLILGKIFLMDRILTLNCLPRRCLPFKMHPGTDASSSTPKLRVYAISSRSVHKPLLAELPHCYEWPRMFSVSSRKCPKCCHRREPVASLRRAIPETRSHPCRSANTPSPECSSVTTSFPFRWIGRNRTAQRSRSSPARSAMPPAPAKPCRCWSSCRAVRVERPRGRPAVGRAPLAAAVPGRRRGPRGASAPRQAL